jgi:pyruvate carboxylase subunit B
MSDVVRKGGFGTSVTPVSQFYVQQAMNNVMFGPWKKIAPPYGQMVLGYFGKTPVPPDAEIVKLASEQLQLEPTDQPPLERNDADPKKGVEAARKALQENGLEDTEENIFIAAACQDKGIKFLKGEGEIGVRKIAKEEAASETAGPSPASSGPSAYSVNVNGKAYSVAIDGSTATVNGKNYQVTAGQATTATAAAPAATSGGTDVKAQMPGVVLKIVASPGDAISKGQSILVLEAMKMEVDVASPVDGTIGSIEVAIGDHVANGQKLATVG